MANYNRNSDLPGAKKVLASESVAPQGSSAFPALIPVVVDTTNMQDSMDGYATCDANTDALKVVFTAEVAIAANQFAGQWAFVSDGTPEVRQVVSNDAAAIAGTCTLTVSIPFDTAPTTGFECGVRLWEDYNVPSFHTSFNGFAEKFVAKSASGRYVLTNIHAAYHSIDAFFKNGGRGAYVLPVPREADAANQAAALLPDADSGTAQRLLALSPQPDLVVMNKLDLLTAVDGASLSSSQWASVDSGWITYVDGRGGNASNDAKLREMQYVTCTATASSSAAITYVGTTVNTTSERVHWTHGRYLSAGVDAGTQEILSPASAVAGVINRVSSNAAESFGHSFFGESFTQLAGSLGLVEKLTEDNQQLLVAQGINPFITVVGSGTYLMSEWTPIMDEISYQSVFNGFIDTLENKSKNFTAKTIDIVIDYDSKDKHHAYKINNRSMFSYDSLFLYLQSVNYG